MDFEFRGFTLRTRGDGLDKKDGGRLETLPFK